jgi:squalene-hopene/tetraprenyl-beta-curcumene cyclase
MPRLAILLALSLLVVVPGGAFAEPPAAPAAPAAPAGLAPDVAAKGEAALTKGAAWLRGLQGEDGGWGDPEIKQPASVGFTAMAVSALVGATPRSTRDSDTGLSKGLAYLVKNQKENGSIWSMESYVTYETSAAVAALAAARRSEHRAALVRARDHLAQSQITADPKDPSYGGFPYASKKPQPADLSNLQFAVDALARGELPADSPVWQRVQAYLKRVQNWSETNTGSIEVREGDEPRTVVSGDDGGGVYGPGMSKADMKKRSDGTWELRSYGSMTYALLKCLLLSGVDPKDPRVLAALAWLASHWTLEKNPGFEEAKDPAKASQQGYYYFLFTAARTLALYEKATAKPLVVRDADGNVHDWRKELVERLAALQGGAGSWKNPVDRWNEGSSVLVTAYAMQAMAIALGRAD